MKVKNESEVAQSCLTLSDPMDYSLPGSSIRGIFQARVLEWGAIAFSDSHDAALLKHQIHTDSQFQLSASHITKHFKIVFECQGVTGRSAVPIAQGREGLEALL